MKSTFHRRDALLRLPLLAALGLAILLCGGIYAYTHSSETGSKHIGPDNISVPTICKKSNPGLHTMQEEQLWGGALNVPKYIGSKYTGPQNVQELMNALDANYNNRLTNIRVSISGKFTTRSKTANYSSDLTISEIDVRYPRVEWLQMLLDKGITINDSYEYASLLSKRYTLALLEDNPDLQQSGVLGIPPTNDWKTYKEAYINKVVNDHVKIREAAKQIEHTQKMVERVKAPIEHSAEQMERAKVQIEGSRDQVKRSKESIARAIAQLKHSIEQVKRAQKELNSQQIEHVRKQLEHAREQIERAQAALEHLKEPMPPQELTPPEKPK